MRGANRGATALALMLVLAAQPLAGPVCAAWCARAPAVPPTDGQPAAHHHGHGPAVAADASDASAARIGALPAHDCFGDNGPMGLASATLTAARADAHLISVETPGSSPPMRGRATHAQPPGTCRNSAAASSSHASLVLRI